MTVAVAAPVEAEPEGIARLRWDTPYYSEHCLKIVNPGGTLVPFVWKPEQVRLFDALERQRLAGEPQRAIILKARKIGFSTAAQAILIQRATTRQYHRSLVVGHKKDTAGELFDIGVRMYNHLPEEEQSGLPWLKPPIANQQRQHMLLFAEPSRQARSRGEVGLDSLYRVDTAEEFEAGRGFTYHSVHLSEVAHWPQVKKLIALLNAVPDEPNTLIIQESTANGFNHFKETWDAAWDGSSAYAPIFSAWFDEPSYSRPFLNEEERAGFVERIGSGPFGEDEPGLVELGVSPEQLNWRRWAILNKNQADVEMFHQEYPSTPEEAFLGSGKRVFSAAVIRRVVETTERTDPRTPSEAICGPEIGVLTSGSRRVRAGRHGRVEVPEDIRWRPGGNVFERWRVWEHPDDGRDEHGERVREVGRYVIGVDPSGADDTQDGDSAEHAIQVIDHRTGVQVAEFASDRLDEIQIGVQAYMAARYWNDAWLAFETTGGYGLAMARMCWQDFGYPFMYFRKSLEDRNEKQSERLGWDTGPSTKRLLISGGRELLRTEQDGIRSRRLASQLLTYIEHKPGKYAPEKGKHADLLMAWLIAQEVAKQKPVRPEKRASSSATMRYVPRDARTGY